MRSSKVVDPAQWRKRHRLLFQALCGATICFDLAFAVLVAIESYDTPKYVYIQAAVFSAVEACYIAAAFTIITMHKFTTSRVDLGVALLPFWMACLSIDISFFVGALDKALLSDWMFRAMCIVAGLSQCLGIALALVAHNIHVLSLYDPTRVFGHGRRNRKQESSEDETDYQSEDDGYNKG